MKKLPKQPFESIALCMSGGGYRAASFHLGAMSYLQRLGLLENVTAISTVSGGTITGVMYALYKEKGESFDQIYQRLIHQLQTRDLIKEGIAKLKKNGQWYNSYKRRNLINALSEIYNEHFTDGNTFEILDKEQLTSHLQLVVFNATEFSNGVNFRFQNRGFMGNNFWKIPKAIQGEIKLADVIAASSCFPGGFEPIGFPGDFQHIDSSQLSALKAEKFEAEDIGLMDGGIYDNQGIDAILLSEKRNRKVYDLIIISDVSSPDMSDFTFHRATALKGFRSKNLKGILKQIRGISTGVLMVIFGLMVGALIVAWLSGFDNNIGTGIGIALLSVGITSFVFFMLVRYAIIKRMKSFDKLIREVVPAFYYNHLSKLDLYDYKMGEYETLILDRVKSLLKLLQDVFLKQIRRLNYAKVYESESHEFRRISNLSKELTEHNLKKSIAKLQVWPNCPESLKLPYDQLLGERLTSIINDAASFGTNLWFTEKDKLDEMLEKLIISGQFNMCFNLLVYMLEIEDHEEFVQYSASEQVRLVALREKLLEDWHQFVATPDFMVGSGFSD